MMQENLIKMYENSFRENRELPALTDYFKGEQFSYFEMAKEISKLHMLFEECKIKPGHKIALIGRNNPRWCIAYIATITYGAVIVPILQDFNANDVHHILNHSESQLLFVGDISWDIIETNRIDNIRAAFSLTDFECIYERQGQAISNYSRDIIKHYRLRYPRGFTCEDIAYATVDNSALALLNYTSGTTGFTKGVMLSLNNLTANVVYGTKHDVHSRGSRVLSFLPLAHAYGCAFDMLLPLAVGSHITLLGRIPAPKVLLEALSEVRPYSVCCVPMIIEKIYRQMVLPLLDKGITRVALKLPLIDTQIYSTIRKKMIEAFGGVANQVIIGGSSLNHEVEDFLIRIKFPFTVGYGMTECAPLISYVSHADFKPHSCGTVLKDIMEARIDSPDPQNTPGEIIVRGENVMIGYYKNEAATREILKSDGWLYTGDVGTMDDDGTLYIRGRNKTMILGSNGQNIYPEEIESKLDNLHCVMESLVVERDGKLVALVYPDYEQADREAVMHSLLPEVMEENLRILNTMVASYEKVSSIVLYPNEFEKTPKKSIKRYLYNV